MDGTITTKRVPGRFFNESYSCIDLNAGHEFMIANCIRRMWQRLLRPPTQKNKLYFRPVIEILEDKIVPSTTVPADATSYLQGLINATPSGGTLVLPTASVPYSISGTLTIAKPITIEATQCLIVETNTNAPAIKVSASHVSIIGLVLQGPQYGGQDSTETAIDITGPSSKAPLSSIDIVNCDISNWGMYGIFLQYVNGFTVLDCNVIDINYGGVVGLSVSNGVIENNSVCNIIGTGNAYGIALSCATADPVSSNVTVEGNVVSNVPYWEGLDTHGGNHIVFFDNVINGCNRGIAIVSATTYSPQNCIVEGNVINSGTTNGTAVSGITVSGSSSTVGALTDLAAGCVVEGNTVIGYGLQDKSLGCAIYLVSTRNLSVIGNAIIEPGDNGIGLYYNNVGFTISGNTIQDPWSKVCAGPAAIDVMSNYNQGFVGGNSDIRGTLSAKYVLANCLAIEGHVSINITYTSDYSNTYAPVYDPSDLVHNGTNGNVYQRTYNAAGSSTATLKISSGVLLDCYSYNAAGQLTAYTTYEVNGNVYQFTFNAGGSATATVNNSSGVLLDSYSYNTLANSRFRQPMKPMATFTNAPTTPMAPRRRVSKIAAACCSIFTFITRQECCSTPTFVTPRAKSRHTRYMNPTAWSTNVLTTRTVPRQRLLRAATVYYSIPTLIMR